MNNKAVKIYKHPSTLKNLEINIDSEKGEEILTGEFYNSDGNERFSIIEGAPDFTYPKELAEIDEETRKTYEKLANEYDKFADIPFKTFKTPEKEVRENLTEKLNIREDSVVLEIGAGDGRGSEYIARKLGENGVFYVQELSSAFLKKAIERLKPYEIKTKIEYSIASAMYLPFAENTFDAAHHFGGFNTFSDQKRCLKELTRVVKPGGKIVIGDEGMAPWLRDTEMGKIMMNSNPLLRYDIPFEIIPIEARDVKVEWIMMGAFFILECTVGEGEPVADYFVPIPSNRGGNHWTRYYGQLEGVSEETKKLAYAAQKISGKNMTQWLDEVIKIAAEEALRA